MPRPKLPKSKRLTDWAFIRLLRDEKRWLIAKGRQRRRAKQKNWSTSALLREGLHLLMRRSA